MRVILIRHNAPLHPLFALILPPVVVVVVVGEGVG